MRRRLLLTALSIALVATACDDDGGDDAPRDVITGDTSAGDTDDDTSTLPDTAVDTVDPGDTTDAGDSTDVSDTVDADTLDACGNGVVEAGEVCDGADLDGETCQSQGFDSGTLACNASCDNYVTTGCVASPDCGNGALDAGEACDGDELDGETCESRGFGGGTLGCLASCTGFDTTGCTSTDACGDGEIDGSEVCDGSALGGETCTSQGFDGGVLGCAGDCSAFDTTGCTVATCGNMMLDTGEQCDDTRLDGESCVTLGWDSGLLGCTANCQFDTSACVREAYPQVGEVVITEIFTAASSTDGWIELTNTASTSVSLNGCTLENDAATEQGRITGADVLAPGDRLTIAQTCAAPGFTPGALVDVLVLEQTGTDAVRIVCDSVVVDTVTWDDATFPDVAGASMQLDEQSLDATANDNGANWCPGQTTFGGSALGTPGATNDCPAVWTIDFCRLQFPVTIDDAPGTSHTIYGRLYIAGLTDQSTGNDPDASLVSELGTGPTNTDPANNASWTWTTAAPNPGWDGASMGVADEDEYQATLTIPGVAMNGDSLDYAYRFSGDGGATWTYCDGQGPGNTDGYQIANAGKLTVTAP